MQHKMMTAVFSTILFFSLFSGVLAKGITRVVSLHVNGMVSPTCPTLLKSAVGKITGVKTVNASLADHSATIEYDESQTSLEAIQATIESSVGFTTRLQ